MSDLPERLEIPPLLNGLVPLVATEGIVSGVGPFGNPGDGPDAVAVGADNFTLCNLRHQCRERQVGYLLSDAAPGPSLLTQVYGEVPTESALFFNHERILILK